MSLSSRVPSFFCWSSNASTWLTLSRPSSTSASAMRSPKVLTGGMGLAEKLADVLDQLGRGRQVPEQAVGGGFGQFFGGLLVEGIGGGHKDGLAHPVKREDAPALAQFTVKTPRQVHVHVIMVQREKR